MSDQNPLPQFSVSDCNPVPVFNCHVIVNKSDQNGRFFGRVANLADITAEGATERDVLQAIAKKFKNVVQEYSQAPQSVPFAEQPDTPKAGEVERFIPVHL